MAKYKSRFAKLSFYVDGERRQFNGGVYETTNKKEIEVLDGLTDATGADQKPAAPKEEPKAEEKADDKPKITSKKSAPRKPSAK